jgi:hypothetical protein
MIPSEYLPMSKVGTSIDCIYLEDALVERIYLNYSYPNSLSFSIDMNLVDWLFMVGIYKSKDQYFLLLDLNDHSSAIDMMIEDGICPNTGLKLISENIAIELTEKISKLGQEYFAIDIPDFHKIMVALVSSMECKIVFSPLLCEEGYFNRINKEIVVANNNSQFCMIWAVVHEYVHYLLNSERNPSRTYEEYLCDNEEYLCDSVAFKLMNSLLGTDRITSIVESLSLKMAYACLDASDL